MSLVPASCRLSFWTCSRAVSSQLSKCTAVRVPIRTKTTKRKPPPNYVRLPKPSAGSASAQPTVLFHSVKDVLEKIKAEHLAEEIIDNFRKASHLNLVNAAVYQLVLQKLCKQDRIEEAIKIIKSSKIQDNLSHLIVISSCAHTNRDYPVLQFATESTDLKKGDNLFTPIYEYIRSNKDGDSTSKESAIKAYESLISGYVSSGDTNSATEVLHHMEGQQLAIDIHFAQILNALGKSKMIPQAQGLMDLTMEKVQNFTSAAACAQFIWTLCASGKSDEAFELYDKAYTFGLPIEELAPKALDVLVQYDLQRAIKLMLRDGEKAGADAYAPFIQALYSQGEQEQAILLLRDIEAKRLPLTQNSVLAAVNVFRKTGHMHKALEWVENFEKQGGKPSDEIQAESLATYLYHGRLLPAYKKLQLLRRSGELSITIYNSFIQGLVLRGQLNEAWQQLKLMKQDEIKPDAQTFANLALCAEAGHVKMAQSAIEKAEEHGIAPTPEMYMSLAVGIAICGNFVDTWKIVGLMEKSDGITDSTLLKTYNKVLHSMVTNFKSISECEDIIKRMLSKNIFPDASTYETLILSHINEGTLDTAFGLFEKLKGLQLTPTLRTLKNLKDACMNSSNMDWYNSHVEQ